VEGLFREDLLPQPGALIGGQYRIESRIGVGGMGAVFAATHVRTNRAVAVKWMLPQASTSADAIARFVVEAQATARIEHPNVVHVYDYGSDNGAPYLVMERLRGETLRARLDRLGRFSVDDAIRTLVPAMRGVAEAHREGIVHRDLKPENIFLCQGKDGTPREAKVVDFGISKLYDNNQQHLTGTGMMMGTPAYMSPEQLNAPKEADPRFDVYALGVILYEMITGRCPYEADGVYALVGLIMHAQPVPPSHLAPASPAIDEIVLRAMYRDPAYRFPSVQALLEAVEGSVGRAAPYAPASAPPPPMPGMMTQPLGGMTPPQLPVPTAPMYAGAATTPYQAVPVQRSRVATFVIAGALALFLGSGVAAAGGWYFTIGPGGASAAAPALVSAPAPQTVEAAAEPAPIAQPQEPAVVQEPVAVEPEEPVAVEPVDAEPIAAPEPVAEEPPVAEPARRPVRRVRFGDSRNDVFQPQPPPPPRREGANGAMIIE
jgi:hypothetical protein